MIALDDALRLLANVDAQQTQIVDMRFFKGPTIASERRKPFREARTEVDWGRRRCCFRPSRRIGSPEKMALVVRESVRVIAAITPLNSLLNLLRRRGCQRGLCTRFRVRGRWWGRHSYRTVRWRR